MLKEQARAVARLVWLADLTLTSAAFLLAFYIRDRILPLIWPDQFPTGLFPVERYLTILPIVLVIWSLLLFSHHTYHSHRTVSIFEEAKTTIRIVGTGVILLATVAWFAPLRQLSRSWFVIFGVLAAVFLLVEKMFVRQIARWVRERGFNYRTILIVGTGRQAREVASLILSHRYWGYKIIGFISDGHRLPGEWSRYRVLGDLSDLKGILSGDSSLPLEPIDDVLFALTRRKLESVEHLFLLCEDLGIRTRVAVNFFPESEARVELEELDGIPFVSYSRVPTNELQMMMKRLLDVGLAGLLMAISLPVTGLAALAIKMTSSGGVLYTQRRVGLNGRVFTLYKFRTMIADAHEKRHEVEHLNEMGGPVFKARTDPRVTPVGRILRRFSLDELPQLWNVLRGDMSMVGPRPPIPEEVNLYERWQRRRLSMKPGLTCLWQVSGRNEVDFDRWVELDLQYIDNWSPLLDFKIMLRTIPAVLSGRGAS